MSTLRIVTYNIHKSRGMDGRVRPQRILNVLGEIEPDIVALQEVLNIANGAPEKDQGRYFAEELKMHYCVGKTRMLRGGIYGNVILSRFPILQSSNYDITFRYEERGCLRADVEIHDSGLLHVFNVHMGTDFFERRHQAAALMDHAILHNPELKAPRIILGDFNEWTLGMATRLLRKHFTGLDAPAGSRRIRTFPGVMPLLALDHIYFEPQLKLIQTFMHRSRTALLASDHLPMVADFELNELEASHSGSGKGVNHETRRTDNSEP